MPNYSKQRYKTKRRTRDADQILNEDLKDELTIQKLTNQDFDEYKPGLAQFYCVPCAHYYESEHALLSHRRTKVHKRQVKNLKNPYTKEEADMAAGRDVEKYLRKAEQQREIHRNPTLQALLQIKKDLMEIPKTKAQMAEMEVEEQQAEEEEEDLIE